VAEPYYEQARAEGKLVLLDFAAPWCGTCPAVDRVLEQEILPRHKDKLLLVKVSVVEHPELADQYGILSVPTVMPLTPERETFWRRSGLFRRGEMEAALHANS
jgi:thiol-disulfide isomerase/thioredoxin